MEKEVELKPIRVVYTNSFGHPSQSDAFRRLEAVVPLKGNKFYATYNVATQEYCACVKIGNDDQTKRFGLPAKILDGGLYAKSEIKGPFLEIVRKIGPTFDSLSRRYRVDASRLPIEFYKRHTHVILYLPVIDNRKGS